MLCLNTKIKQHRVRMKTVFVLLFLIHGWHVNQNECCWVMPTSLLNETMQYKNLINYQSLLGIEKFDVEPAAAIQCWLHSGWRTFSIETSEFSRHRKHCCATKSPCIHMTVSTFSGWLQCIVSEQGSGSAKKIWGTPSIPKEWKQNSKVERSAEEMVWEVIAGRRNGGRKEETGMPSTWKK